MTEDEFHRAATVAREAIIAKLPTYVRESNEPERLAIVAMLDGEPFEIEVTTRESLLAMLRYSWISERIRLRIANTAWPAIPIVFMRKWPGEEPMADAGHVWATKSMAS
jgi:hypothetical protein